MKIYSIKDNVAQECGPLTTLKNDAVACRWFKYQLANAKVNVDDFTLLCLGDVDIESGVIVPSVRVVEMTDVEPDGKPVNCEVVK